jgi:hypothetical protein
MEKIHAFSGSKLKTFQPAINPNWFPMKQWLRPGALKVFAEWKNRLNSNLRCLQTRLARTEAILVNG